MTETWVSFIKISKHRFWRGKTPQKVHHLSSGKISYNVNPTELRVSLSREGHVSVDLRMLGHFIIEGERFQRDVMVEEGQFTFESALLATFIFFKAKDTKPSPNA